MNIEFLVKLSRPVATAVAVGLLSGSLILTTGCEPEPGPPQQPPPGEATTDHLDRQTDRDQADPRLREDERLGDDEISDDEPGGSEDGHIAPSGIRV